VLVSRIDEYRALQPLMDVLFLPAGLIVGHQEGVASCMDG
jgi:hypothetical protein